ncbi:DUF6470 family protein [Paenibacillus sp. GCM10027626]|uniref:DUF6470 family protein n=1 Tax=Paenibacillus sp. GCM10027626 TaxID=3273411 RepID=UPI00364023FC
MRLPIIQATSQQGKIAIESELGHYNIRSRPADLQIETTRPQISASTPAPDLDIDSSRMWEAFNGGKPEVFWNKIYSQMPEIALQAIARIVERGNQMGDLRIQRNPIPDLAYEAAFEPKAPLQIFGPATPHNVDIHFTVHKPDVEVTPGRVDVRVQVNRPEIEYQRRDVKVTMEQYPRVQFYVPNVDIRA